VREASASVAPVVMTSSTRAMRAPHAGVRTATPRTFRWRAPRQRRLRRPVVILANGAASGNPVPRATRDLARLVEARSR
jgi:hypothetical protein